MQTIICNPLDLEYRYQYRTSLMGAATLSREAADPTMLLFRDTYYLFASMSAGFWYSDDLAAWQYKATPELPAYDYAPDVREIGGRVVFSASRHGEPCTLFASADPLREPFTALSTPFSFWDPDVFEDDDGRVYFYWGCTNTDPIWGVELDRESFLPLAEEQALFGEDEARHGWERKGENNKLGEPQTEYERLIRQYVGTKPFIEGAYMTKHCGNYYLQYAAPGTESNSYADGVYVGKAPLGPFVYQAHNPFSSKPGGFITAAGHGSTFQDKHGSWWHVSTMRISVNESYERRIGLFPCDFDADGVLHCNQCFADYPFALPDGARADAAMQATAPKWQLLAHTAVTASSEQTGFGAAYGADENIRTWWAAEESDSAPWYKLDLGAEKQVAAVQINLADHKLPQPQLGEAQMVANRTGARYLYPDAQQTGYVLEGSQDGEQWQCLLDTCAEGSDRAHRLWVPESAVAMRYVRLCGFAIPFGGIAAISGLRVFGAGTGAPPAQTANVQAQRSADGLNLLLQWPAAPRADGYNIRYGIAPDKLYSSWQVTKGTALDISTLNAGQGYYFTVDSYNENGVTAGELLHME